MVVCFDTKSNPWILELEIHFKILLELHIIQSKYLPAIFGTDIIFVLLLKYNNFTRFLSITIKRVYLTNKNFQIMLIIEY